MSVRSSLIWMFAGLACKNVPPPAPTAPPSVEPTDIPDPTLPPTDAPPEENALLLPAARPVETPFFATSDACADCHSNHTESSAMRDLEDHGVAPFDLWQSSMMANAARDPLWRAVVSAEIAATPAAAAVIGERCMTCHAPMAYAQSVFDGVQAPVNGSLTDGSALSDLALDGVSCTLCHQIEADDLGQESTWKGNYSLSTDRTLYGPHSAPSGAAMQAAGWTPEASDHINNPGLCATCHTLTTNALTPDGALSGGSVVEQSPYLEMLNSFAATSSCQSCHFPSGTDSNGSIHTPIARNPDGTDDLDLISRGVGRHVVVGGNTLIPQLFRDNQELLQPNASPAAFDATIASAQSQLRNRTAFLSLDNELYSGDSLTFDTRITLQSGHKFPTGIPLRRAWIRLSVTDATGQQMFLSGDFDTAGNILVDGQPAPFEVPAGPLAPHLMEITSDSQVQVYEAVLSDLNGAPTYLLLRGAGYIKDNRLLPEGWSPNHMHIEKMAPAGVEGDLDYTSGGDTLSWTLDLTGGTPPFAIDARLYYQTLSTRFANELFLADTPETRGLQALLDAADRSPDLVAHASASIE